MRASKPSPAKQPDESDRLPIPGLRQISNKTKQTKKNKETKTNKVSKSETKTRFLKSWIWWIFFKLCFFWFLCFFCFFWFSVQVPGSAFCQTGLAGWLGWAGLACFRRHKDPLVYIPVGFHLYLESPLVCTLPPLYIRIPLMNIDPLECKGLLIYTPSPLYIKIPSCI